MKRKTLGQGVGSLELLLDTICNTFGGILLISLLVALLLNVTSRELREKTASPQSHAALLQSEIERERAARQLSDLRDAVKRREGVVGKLLPAELIAEAREYRDARLRHAELVERKIDNVGGSSRAQARLNEVAIDDADLRAKLEQARRDAAEASKKLAEQVSARSRDASIPRVRLAKTSARAYFVVQQRLFGPWPKRQYGAGNDDEFQEASRGSERVLLPKPGAGVAIASDGKNLDEIKARFSNIDSHDEHVQILVWPDSYGEFDPVRRAVTELGVMLELVPMARSAEATIGPQSRPSFVQ
jgi:hypothetical protein